MSVQMLVNLIDMNWRWKWKTHSLLKVYFLNKYWNFCLNLNKGAGISPHENKSYLHFLTISIYDSIKRGF